MQENKHSEPKRIELSDLLKLKRHEKPSPEFWSAFEREYKEKQLRSLVIREPKAALWWRGFWGKVGSLVPATAAAIFVFGIFLGPVTNTASRLGSPEKVAEVSYQAEAGMPEYAASNTLAQDLYDFASASTTYVVGTLNGEIYPAMGSGVTMVPATRAMPASNRNGVRFASATFPGNGVGQARSQTVSAVY